MVSWKPSDAGAPGNRHKYMLGTGVTGVENLGGDLDKVTNKRFRFYCFPFAGIWEMAVWPAAWRKLTKMS